MKTHPSTHRLLGSIAGGLAALVLLAGTSRAGAQAAAAPTTTAPAKDPLLERVQALEQQMRLMKEQLAKSVDDVQWFQRAGDLAVVEKIRFTGPPPRVTNNPTAQGAGNPVIIPAYTFIPRKAPEGAKLPLLVLVHGGVHGDFHTFEEFNMVRELLQQGYAIIAPEYRGSTGYGKEFWEQIDYGALETEDVFAGRQWMVENHPEIDPDRVGILGWSHGGMITLMNIFDHPAGYKAAYAGVPVSDLVARMGYKNDAYRGLFSAPYHIGKTAEDNVAEYRRRSPAWNAEKLQTPLLVHGATNDEDVNVLEVEHLIKSLKAAGKDFEYKIYTNPPGGHRFNRIETKLARESRREVYQFLARHLKPPYPVP